MDALKIDTLTEILNNSMRTLPHTQINNTIATAYQEGHETDPYTVLFIFAVLLVGACVRQLMSHWPIPYTVLLMILGVALGAISSRYPSVSKYTKFSTTDPHLVLTTFLPVLLFESAFAMDVHTFYKMFLQVIILAIPGMTLASFLTAVMSYYVFSYNWDWNIAMLFGSLISATDPVAVVAVLNNLGTSRQLGTIIEAESLLNDGCAIVLFNMFFALAFKEVSTTRVILFFPQLAFGGFAFGLVAGKITVFWLQNVYNDALVEITITLVSTYLTFYIGEFVLEVSGVLAVVMLGMEINAQRTSISPEQDVFLHRFWEMLAYLANTLIFVIVGVAITEKAFEELASIDILYIIIDYLGVTVIRALVILCFSPLLTRLGYGLEWNNAVVMIWGGLRGAVGLALALQVALDHKQFGSKMLVHTAGIVLLTLIFNATTIKPLLKALGMSDISDAKRVAMTNAVNRLHESRERSLAIMKTDRFMADADWQRVETSCIINNPYEEGDDEETGTEDILILRHSKCPQCASMVPNQPTAKEFAEMTEEGRIAIIKAEKISFWKQYERGLLSSESVQVLVNLADTCIDEKDRFIQLNDLYQHWSVPRYWDMIRTKLEHLKQMKASDRVPPPRNIFLRYNYMIATHVAFDVLMNVLIALNIIPIAFELTSDDDAWYIIYLKYINYVYCGIFMLEALIKILGFRKHYFKDYWNILDLFIVFLSMVDIVLDIVAAGSMGGFSPSVLKVAKIFRLLRMGRVLKLIKTLIPKMIDLVNDRINRQLSFGYDIGKGFVVAEEEVMKMVDQLIADQKIMKELKMRSEKNRLDIIKSLGLLQREHPGIAISVKTRQASRSVLNNALDTLSLLRSNGVMDKSEAVKLERFVQEKMKRQLNAPSYIAPKKPESLLRGLPWLRTMTEETVSFVIGQMEMISYEFGDVMLRQGEPTDGIYLIVSGMVKLVGVSIPQDGTMNPIETRKDSELNISTDYLCAGNVIGEMGLLTSTKRNASVVCETAVQVYYVPTDRMLQAIKRFPGLEDSLWRVCGVRVALPLLQDQAAYKGLRKDHLRILCENSAIAELSDSALTASFTITERMIEAVLIHGEINCASTKEITYSGPCLLPNKTKQFIYNIRKKPKILVIWKMSQTHRPKSGGRSTTTIAEARRLSVNMQENDPLSKLDAKRVKSRIEEIIVEENEAKFGSQIPETRIHTVGSTNTFGTQLTNDMLTERTNEAQGVDQNNYFGNLNQ